MPSFVPDAVSATDSQPPGVVHLDRAAEFGLSEGKVNGHIPRQPHPHSHTSNESFDESSTDSTKSSNTSETSVETEHHGIEDCSRSASMNSPPNGSAGGGIDGAGASDCAGRKPPPFGSSISLVDRTLPSSAARASGAGAESQARRPEDDSMHRACVEVPPRPASKGDRRAADAALASTSPHGASAPTLTAEASTSGSGQKNHRGPHRFSSPPDCEQTPSSSGPPQPSPVPGIKQRHTLEVPKAPSGRGSRDGIDVAYASGRFSPTITGSGGRTASLSLGRRNTRSLNSEGPRDEVVPDEDAMRWAEAYRQKRASKRKKREIEDDDRVLVGTKVDESHANWVTAYNMLTGIRVSVSRTNAKLDRPLTDADFDVKQKSTFDIAGNELVPSAKYDFKFKDYAPWVFRHLRALFRLDPADYLMSLTGKYILSELGSPGKSGSFFYFSRDYKYIIKTIHHGEHKFLRKILKDYYQHVKDNPNTLLSQFYGLHRVKMPYGKKIHFVVMNNLFPPHRDIHQTFDLKGSTVGRDFKEEDLEKNPRATLKDLNWLRRKRHLELGIQKKQLFLEQLHKDVRLLQRLQIMDYSLLIGIHDLQRGNDENLRDKTLRVFNPGGDQTGEDFDPNSVLMRTPSKLENQRKARELRQMIQSEKPVPMGETSSRMPDELEEGQNRRGFIFNQDDGGFRATHEDNEPGDEIYYLGVIDCLTHYGIIKKIEHFWKGLSSDRSQISALPPQEYGERFINFISNVTMSQEEALRAAQERDAALAAEAAASEERQRTGSWGSGGRVSCCTVPPSPCHQPPPPPSSSPSGQRSAQQQQGKKNEAGRTEDNVPERTLRTIATPSNHGPSGSGAERREAAVLPVVEEAVEGASTGDPSHGSLVSSLVTEGDGRPSTPRKDGDEKRSGLSSLLFGGRRNNSSSSSSTRPPPTPPKNGSAYGGRLKPDSADSGYGVSSNGGSSSGLRSRTGSQKSLNVQSQIGRDSLDKALPPLPKMKSGRPQDVS